MRISVWRAAAFGWLLATGATHAQDEPQPSIPFEGGTLTITETDEGEKVVAFDGKELARNFVAYFDKIVEVGGIKVALFAVGDGGNQCGPAEAIVWKPQGGDIQTQMVGEDCGAPPAAITGSSIYFVPYLLPGETNNVQVWAPDTGLAVAGTIAYAPQPGTDWKDLDPAKFEYMIDSMKNAAVYAAAQALLGEHLLDVVTGLQTGGTTETTKSGIFYASGCVPHACGGADAFMAIDPHGRKLYFAQQGDNPQPSAWPVLKTWPAEIKTLMQQALGPQ